jgi:trehalose 6-phosphate phosphatase
MPITNRTDVPGASERRPRDLAETLRLTAARAQDTGCFFDFDGTLSRIDPNPSAARLVPGALAALDSLTRMVRKVALISARPVDFLTDQLPDLPQIALFGLYGLESRVDAGPVVTHPDAATVEPIMADLARRAEAELPTGVFVEFKRLSVALHYRKVPDRRAVVEEWAAAVARELGLGAQAGRMVVEMKPPGDRGKGAVLSEQLSGLSCGWFFGDDLSDLQAFAALDVQERIDHSFLGVRVAVANPESGAAVRGAADHCLGGPDDVPAFLTTMVETMKAAN